VRKLKAKRGGVPKGFFLKTWLGGVGGWVGGWGGKKKGKTKVRRRRRRRKRQANNWRHHLLRDKILKGNDG
jgi:hypothetical protein